MKKITALLLVFAIFAGVFCLASCTKNEGTDSAKFDSAHLDLLPNKPFREAFEAFCGGVYSQDEFSYAISTVDGWQDSQLLSDKNILAENEKAVTYLLDVTNEKEDAEHFAVKRQMGFYFAWNTETNTLSTKGAFVLEGEDGYECHKEEALGYISDIVEFNEQ
jgi:hypothetical protein